MSRTRVLAAHSLIVLLALPALAQAQDRRAPRDETPSQFYLRYRAAVQNATTMDDVLAYWTTATANEFRSAPPDQRVDLAGVQRIYGMYSDVDVARFDVESPGDHVTLTLKGKTSDGKPMSGTATLAREDGRWKVVGPERWEP